MSILWARSCCNTSDAAVITIGVAAGAAAIENLSDLCVSVVIASEREAETRRLAQRTLITIMLDHVLPRSIDNTYRGHRLAFVPFVLLVLLKLTIGVNSIIHGYAVMTTADGIPLDTFPPAAVQSLVSLWALLGLAHVVIGLLCVLVLVRYRSMIPFMFALLLFQNLGGQLISHYLPLVRTGAPPAFIVNLTLLTLMIVGLGLSLWRRSSVQPAPRITVKK